MKKLLFVLFLATSIHASTVQENLATLDQIHDWATQLFQEKITGDSNEVEKLLNNADRLIAQFAQINADNFATVADIFAYVGRFYALGCDCGLKPDITEALLFFEKVIEIETEYPEKVSDRAKAITHVNLGNKYFDEKNYMSALPHFELAASLTKAKRPSDKAKTFLAIMTYEGWGLGQNKLAALEIFQAFIANGSPCPFALKKAKIYLEKK